MIDQRRGVLYPTRMPQFHRLAAPLAVRDLVEWFWIPEWDLPRGEVSTQHIVSYPALNLVVTATGVSLAGATTRVSHRELTGRGWAVGALLKPAAVAALVTEPAELCDIEMPVDAPDLLTAVTDAMADADGDRRRERAVERFGVWLAARVGEVTPVARQANAMVELLLTDATVRRADEAAVRLALSLRTVQRLAHRHVGLPPLAMIRRRRLQEAAQRVRDDPGCDLSALAADLGYADHAHLTRDFRDVLGFTPSYYRARLV